MSLKDTLQSALLGFDQPTPMLSDGQVLQKEVEKADGPTRSFVQVLDQTNRKSKSSFRSALSTLGDIVQHLCQTCFTCVSRSVMSDSLRPCEP